MLKNNNIMCLLKKNNQENYPVVKIVAIAHHPYTQIIYLVYLPLVSISRQTQIISEKFSSIEAKVQNRIKNVGGNRVYVSKKETSKMNKHKN